MLTLQVLQCHQVGTLVRGGRGRVVGLSTDPGQSVLACHGTDALLELFSFCSDDEAKLRMDKRVKKQRKKLAYVLCFYLVYLFLIDYFCRSTFE